MSHATPLDAPSYNKAQSPGKLPNEKQYPFVVNVENHGTVRISRPIPDKLHLVGDVLPEHFSPNFKPDCPEGHGALIMKVLATSGAIGTIVGYPILRDGIYRRVQVRVHGTDADVFFQLANAPKKSNAAHRLSIQMNPARLGQMGFYELLDRMMIATNHAFNFGAFLSEARVKRIDVAVDFVGLAIEDMVVAVKGEGKRTHYLGSSGKLETISVFKKIGVDKNGQPTKKGLKKPQGDRLATVYDKRQERLDRGFPPPFGDMPVTRLEVSKVRFGNKPFILESLANMKDPLSNVEIAALKTLVAEMGESFPLYVQARLGGSHDLAIERGAVPNWHEATFQQAYAHPGPNLIDAYSLWNSWRDSIDAIGLNYMIEAAEQKALGVPMPIDEAAE